ncbi:endonuclease YncB(thermonuclease family) [Bradyrhizobium macuxiense]|uniref:Endonuclease YncB(Thermonuclease family) n=1 Tax=Bradyrhizobium macuxiense TaxID=1755647 RepID=A0A560M0X6_9BRAD|nr:thermonuclease family protein [Bradyrhizobium macuxiense]TWC01329.1 endonuclease YncB(thermonuclease family) [Bradyrhizobium macuxiense]
MQTLSMQILPTLARSILLGCTTLLACSASHAAGCNFEIQGEGRVAAVVDARSLRLDDGREVRLAGIEVADRAKAMAALTAQLVGRDVTLRGQDDTPDRYGRQPAYAFLKGSETPVQSELLRQGLALVSSEIADKDCAAALMAAESEARTARSGTWAEATVIKNAESPDDILAGIGRFTVVEGRVLTVRQAGATTYLNFGRNWTRDFALTISRRIVPAFEAAGLSPKSLENRRIRVRGWVEARRGPRIELLRVGQIELLGGN